MADHPSPPAGAKIRVIVVTPEQTVLDHPTTFVALPLYDGELGIAAGHAPMIGRLGFGELRIGSEPADQRRMYVDGGFVQVVDNLVSILTNRAVPAQKLDATAIQATLSNAVKQKAAGEDQISRRDRVVAQARAQLRVARRSY